MIKVLTGPALIIFLLLIPKITIAQDIIVINEFVAHPSTDKKEWVEFYNPQSTDFTSYYLDDDVDFTIDVGSSKIKSLASINTSSPNFPYLEFDSFLNNSGDFVVLFSPDGTLVDQYQYTDDPGTDVVMGRYPDGTGDFIVLAASSKGLANTPGLPSPSPSPSPTPDPSESPQASQTTSSNTQTTTQAKSPTPTPKPSPKPTPTKSPQPTPKPSPEVLAAADESLLASAQDLPSPSSSPLSQAAKTPNNLKFAITLVGTGSILIGLATFLYLWYSKKLTGKNEEQSEFVQN